MELDPELRPQQPLPKKAPELSRPVPENLGPQWDDVPQSKPEVLASREEMASQPPHAPLAPPPTRVKKPGRLLPLMLLLLAAGGAFLWPSRDIKEMTGKDPGGQVEFVADEIVVDLKDDVPDEQIAALNRQFG